MIVLMHTASIVKALVCQIFWIAEEDSSNCIALLVITYSFLMARTTAWVNGDDWDVILVAVLKFLKIPVEIMPSNWLQRHRDPRFGL
jgi:uncharacterized membrane protein